MILKCDSCGGDLDTNQKGNFREITHGYGQKRSAGGANAVRKVVWGDTWIHEHCMNLETKEGVNAMQQRIM